MSQSDVAHRARPRHRTLGCRRIERHTYVLIMRFEDRYQRDDSYGSRVSRVLDIGFGTLLLFAIVLDVTPFIEEISPRVLGVETTAATVDATAQ